MKNQGWELEPRLSGTKAYWSRTVVPHLLLKQRRGSCLSLNMVWKAEVLLGLRALGCSPDGCRSVSCAVLPREMFSFLAVISKDEMIELFLYFCVVCFWSGAGMKRSLEVRKGLDTPPQRRVMFPGCTVCFQQGQPLTLTLPGPQFSGSGEALTLHVLNISVCKVKL